MLVLYIQVSHAAKSSEGATCDGCDLVAKRAPAEAAYSKSRRDALESITYVSGLRNTMCLYMEHIQNHAVMWQ